jgi:ELWxxDGT repeat protein
MFIYEDLLCNNGTLYFRTQTGTGLWKSDGTAKGTTRLTTDFIAQSSILIHNNKIVYATASSNSEIWIVDGAGSTRLKQLHVSSNLMEQRKAHPLQA